MQFVTLAMAIIGLIQAGIGLAEKLRTGKGQGPEKKEAVTEGVVVAVATGVANGTLRGDFKTLDPAILRGGVGMLIDLAVTISNKLGWTEYTLDSPDTSDNAKLNALANQA